MKQVALAAINAKFIHSNLAIRYLSRFQNNRERFPIREMEFTINQRADFILQELCASQPDLLFFSCYIWNIELIKQLCGEIKKVLPQCGVYLGGPEVSYDSETLLSELPGVDGILCGEGELSFTRLLECLCLGALPLEQVPGLTYRDGGGIHSNPEPPALDLSLLPFPYEQGFPGLENRILYYETQRGCPYRCAYCLSSVSKGVRFLPLEKVYRELQIFLDAKPRQVKLVDRTFNCNAAHAMAIWRYLAEHDNGVTNFHFELTADIITREMLDFFPTVRKGLFQFEIGVQSTNVQTMDAIERNVRFEKLSAIVKEIHRGENIHQHLDLIAGLPYECYPSFRRSFNDVYALSPDQFQLGFLKILKGSALHQKAVDFGIQYRSYAPYEVLSTHWISYKELCALKGVEEMVELFYNSGRYRHSISYLIRLSPSPFEGYESLSRQWMEQGRQYQSPSPLDLCDFLHDSGRRLPGYREEVFQWLLKLDLCLHGKLKKLPGWLRADHNPLYRERILSFYEKDENVKEYLPSYRYQDPKLIYKTAHIEVFDWPVLPGEPVLSDGRQALLFDYTRRDLLGNALCRAILL